MSAAEGNKYAEKWTEESTLEALDKVYQYIKTDIDCYSLARALNNTELYPQWWAAITEKFQENTQVSVAIKRVEQSLEDKITTNVMTGEAKSASMGIFLLKNKHGYVDKKEVEQSGNQTIQVISPTPLPDMNGWDKTEEK